MAAYDFKGGESEGLKRLEEYISSNSIPTYKKDRNGFIGVNFSSKLSPWIANGSLSIRQVYHNVVQIEKSDFFIKHLFVRDFWKFWAMHHGNKIFFKYGAQD